ncbi:hypothetical protein DFP73DRAFT_561022, partial [Morchella snyderi]
MKFTAILTTAILLLSAAADAYPQPAADATSLTLNSIPHSKRDPAATTPRRTTKASTKSTTNKVKSAPSKKKPTTLSKKKTSAATVTTTKGKKQPATKQKGAGAAGSQVCMLPSARGGKKGGLGKRGCGEPAEKEKLLNCSLCPGLRKRGKGQRNKKKNVLGDLMAAPLAKDNVDDLVDETDCWRCDHGKEHFIFTGTQVKKTAVDALKRNLNQDFITYTRPNRTPKSWPHPYGNVERALPVASGELREYITFPLYVDGLFTNGAPGEFRVTIGLSTTLVPQTVNVVSFIHSSPACLVCFGFWLLWLL